MIIQRRRPTPTRVFDSYWYFAAERQRIFRARLRHRPGPLTHDPILQSFKFTNSYRASDRTTQYLIRNVIYDRPRPFVDVFARVLLFKLFNRIETWAHLQATLGELTAEAIEVDRLAEVLEQALHRGERIYSAAYIMPPAGAFGSHRKHVNHLRLLRVMLADHADARINEADSMAYAFEILTSYPSIGRFLGYQLLADLSYSHHLHFKEDEFVAPGPGALDGLSKCFRDPGELSPPEIIRWTMETQREQFERRGIEFPDLWGRQLQLIDCQNLYCEISKYARAAHPQVVGLSGRQRIKQRFRPRVEPPTAWYPPKWGVNEAVCRWLSSSHGEQTRSQMEY
jgi:5-hmdU DNA kinase, helical domain